MKAFTKGLKSALINSKTRFNKPGASSKNKDWLESE